MPMPKHAQFWKTDTKAHELSAYLLEKETITGEEFMYILEHGRPETKNETAGEVIDTTAAAADESAEAKEPAAQAEETGTAGINYIYWIEVKVWIRLSAV